MTISDRPTMVITTTTTGIETSRIIQTEANLKMAGTPKETSGHRTHPRRNDRLKMDKEQRQPTPLKMTRTTLLVRTMREDGSMTEVLISGNPESTPSLLTRICRTDASNATTLDIGPETVKRLKIRLIATCLKTRSNSHIHCRSPTLLI